MNLPTQPTPPTAKSPKTLVIYGPPKIGKTSIITALPSPYLLVEIESNGAAYVEAVKLELTCIEQFVALEEALKKNKYPYRFVVLDTLDTLEEWCEKEATKRYKQTIQGRNFSGDSVVELPQGGGYFWLRNVFYEYFQRIRMLAPNVIFIGHIRDRMLTSTLSEVASKDLDLTGKVKNIVCAYADAIGHAFRDKDGKFKISFETKETVQCGSRCQHLTGKTFEFSQPATADNWKQIYID